MHATVKESQGDADDIEDDDENKNNIIGRTQLQTYNIENVNLDDKNWNKIHLSVYPTNVSVFVNCQKVSHFVTKPRQTIDITGDTWLSKYDDDFSTVPV